MLETLSVVMHIFLAPLQNVQILVLKFLLGAVQTYNLTSNFEQPSLMESTYKIFQGNAQVTHQFHLIYLQ
jgi:hypothetical protein